MSVSVVEITVASRVEPWSSIGLRVVDNTSRIGGISLRITGDESAGHGGIVGWTLADSVQRPLTIDGLPTEYAPMTSTGDVTVEAWEHPLGARSFDHLVVMTSSLERTCGAVTATTGAELRRVREAGPVRQGFHRMGPIILEVVESDRVTSDQASFWGFVLVVDDLDAAVDRLGPELIGSAREAVQPGRRIASFRSSAGLGVPVALMTP